MGLIKRQQVEALAQQPAKSAAPPKPDFTEPIDVAQDDPVEAFHESEEEDGWDWDAFLAGELPDRRQSEERRTDHRRESDHALLATAQEEAESIRQSAYQSGYEDGLAEAHQAIEQLQAQFAALLQGRDQVVEDMVKQLGPLSVAIAEKILKAEVSCDDSLIDRLARETLQKAGKDVKTVMIKVHPEQLTSVRAAFREHPPEGLHADISVVDDETVDWGSCVVETDSGLIDARFSTQLALLQKLLF